MKMNRKVAISFATVGMVTLSAGAAMASGTESGYQSCAGVGSQEVVSRGYTTGTPTHIQNGVAATFLPSSGYQVTNFNNLNRTANWTVKTTGTLNAAGTYAYCPS